MSRNLKKKELNKKGGNMIAADSDEMKSVRPNSLFPAQVLHAPSIYGINC